MTTIIQILTALWIAIDFWLLGVTAIFCLLCYIMWRLDRANDVSFRFHDFFTSGDWPGKPSAPRLAYFGGFFFHSFIVLHQEMNKTLSTEHATAYALIWSGMYAVVKYVDRNQAPLQPPTTLLPPGGTNGTQP
jgi:hypothetical protein